MIPLGFALEWQAAWNSHDLDRILAHYAADVVFRSAKAVSLVRTDCLQGQDALRQYWAAALSKQPNLRFDVIDVFTGADMLVITYRNHKDRLAAETLRFDAAGQVVEASACHGPERGA
ncbi:MAG: nuclear transport factor 2 family protein [Pseudomonadota bacterium]